jgi:N-acetylneuraminate synthase
VGEGHPVFIVAEIGINHNGDIALAKKLIDAAILSGCDGVKFQKRTVDIVYTAEELARPRESPFGTTNGDLKRGLEFGVEHYREIDRHCRERGIIWYVSCWDEGSVDFIEDNFDVACYKIASASITDDNLLRHHRATGKPIIISTGMTTLEQIDHAVDVLGKDDLVMLHCTSTYPSKVEELNLRVIDMLKERYGVPIGYSGHEVGLATTLAAATMGACMVERHTRLVKDIRAIEAAMGDGVKQVYESELPIIAKLRRV